MRTHIKKALCALSISALVLGYGQQSASSAKLNMGYLYFGSTQSYIKQVDDTRQALNRVSPTLFDLTPEGDMELAFDVSVLVREMHKRNVKVVPFLSNHWNRETGRAALRNREAVAADIAEAVARYNLDGVNVDIENVTEADRDAYTDLVRLLRQKLPAGKEVSVAIAANPAGWTKGWQGSYDLAKLSSYSDYLMLMSYDENWDGDDTPGPTASLPWVEKSVQQALKEVSPDKLLLGIPFYGRYWSEDGRVKGSGVSNKVAEALAKRYGITPEFDDATQTPTFTFTVHAGDDAPVIGYKKLQPGTYTVWFDNEESIKRKLDLVHKYGLRGTGSWALSQESPEMWTYYASWLNDGVYYADTGEHWAKEDIRNVSLKGWMQGTAPSMFGPAMPLTRSQAAAILVRALKLADKPEPGAGTVSAATSVAAFKDVPANYWGRAEIDLARRFGLVEGMSPGVFAPEIPVTREEMSAMLSRALGLKATGVTAAAAAAGFSDVPAGRWSYKAVRIMQQKGLIDGYSDGTFQPGRTMSRAEAAALLNRSAELLAAQAKISN